ncbi:MAG: hypothetical protein JXQ68_03095 [Campylobacterales bacterium]|nr:hypothetical protein [Campylobacterales bacterium]
MPAISLGFLENIEAIPHLLHPPIVHFIVAIPVIVLLVEIINIIFNRRTLSGFAFSFLLALCFLVLVAYAAGSVDGKAAFDALSDAGQEELKAHKALGAMIVIGAFVVLLFKFIAMLSSHPLVRATYILVLALFVGAILKQGKDGGELIYEHGANVVKVKELDDKLFDLEMKLDELTDSQEKIDAKTSSVKPQEMQGVKSVDANISSTLENKKGDINVTTDVVKTSGESNATQEPDTIEKIKKEAVKIKDKVDAKIEKVKESVEESMEE